MEGLLGNLISFIISPSFDGWLFLLRIVFILVSLVAVVAMIFFAFKTPWFKFFFLEDFTEFMTYRPFGVRKIEKIWIKIKSRLNTGLESEYKLAVIEADSMLDDILKRMGFGGETLEERMQKITSATLPNLDEAKEIHQVRNNIVHDPDYQLSLDKARKILDVYEQSFKALQAF
ncbi:MAG: hypothetical protein ABIG08_00865 [bacterium]